MKMKGKCPRGRSRKGGVEERRERLRGVAVRRTTKKQKRRKEEKDGSTSLATQSSEAEECGHGSHDVRNQECWRDEGQQHFSRNPKPGIEEKDKTKGNNKRFGEEYKNELRNFYRLPY
jgi:hypothetical protein